MNHAFPSFALNEKSNRTSTPCIRPQSGPNRIPSRRNHPMAVMMQAFYWDAPRLENKEHEWWNFVAEKVEDLCKAGFNALWLPPVTKASSNTSMGYDPYD